MKNGFQKILFLIVLFCLFYMVLIGVPGIVQNKPFCEPRTGSIVIKNDTVYCDTLRLSLHKIPPIKDLHTVAKVALDKWAKLFIVLKIEESGYDNQNSIYALKYNNLVGMRYPNQRETTARRKGYSSYCVFDNWYDCIIDFKYYIENTELKFIKLYQRKPHSEKEMIKFMHGSYNAYSQWYRDVFWLLDDFEE